MIYFDNAATGGFKPFSVTEAAVNTVKYLSANPGRSGHRLSAAGAEIVFKTRRELSSFFNSGSVEHTVFTKNCTEALNTAIFGTVKPGGHVITTENEHNSVLRPLYRLESLRQISLSVAKTDPKTRLLDYGHLESLINENTYLIVVNQISNVTGAVTDIRKISEIIGRRGIILAVDAAQSAGHIPIDMQEDGIDILCFAGHKGMYGIPGSGGLLFRENIDVQPFMFGGTGTESFSAVQPGAYPERLESGTLNLPAINSLFEGVLYLKKNMTSFSQSLITLTGKLKKGLEALRQTVYSEPNPAGIISFSNPDIPSQELAQQLSDNYDIAVRGGLHCAPLIHKRLKTDKDGLVRLSLSPHNSLREIDYFLSCLAKIV